MILKLETERLSTLDEVRMFVAGSAAVDFAGLDRESTYEFTRRTLARFGYGRLGKADKGLLRRYLTKATGLSRAQVARLIAQHAATGRIVDRRGGAPSKPSRGSTRRRTRGGWRRRTRCSASCRGRPRGP